MVILLPPTHSYPMQILLAVLILVASLTTTSAQWPMYVPGDPIDRSVIPVESAVYGFTYGSGYACTDKIYSIPCAATTIPDPSLCKNMPPTVSRTAYITPAILLNLESHGTLTINCGTVDYAPDDQKPPPGTKVVYTTDGTYPDIYGPSYDYPVTINFAANEYMFVLARCLEPGKTAGEIAYVERKPTGAYLCAKEGGEWKYETHYRPLNLPQCQPWIIGADKCDGQTVVDQGSVPSPSLPPSPMPIASIITNSPTSQDPIASESPISMPSAAIGVTLFILFFVFLHSA